MKCNIGKGKCSHLRVQMATFSVQEAFITSHCQTKSWRTVSKRIRWMQTYELRHTEYKVTILFAHQPSRKIKLTMTQHSNALVNDNNYINFPFDNSEKKKRKKQPEIRHLIFWHQNNLVCEANKAVKMITRNR